MYDLLLISNVGLIWFLSNYFLNKYLFYRNPELFYSLHFRYFEKLIKKDIEERKKEKHDNNVRL